MITRCPAIFDLRLVAKRRLQELRTDFQFRISNRKSQIKNRKSAFSLTEVLIVIAIIVLILALALPAFNFITGGKSVDGGMNQISAFLARARIEAIGLQEVRGVMFYIDPATERQTMVLVKEVTAPTPTPNVNVEVWLDAFDADHIPLPKGVGIQLANDAATSGGADRYLGFNSYTDGAASTIKVGGVILFDGNGRLASMHYGFKMQTTPPAGPPAVATSMAQLITPYATVALADFTPTPPPAATPAVSSFGFALFDQGTMSDKFGTDATGDPYFGASTLPADEANEETWIDENATAVLINRYNGTLVKGE